MASAAVALLAAPALARADEGVVITSSRVKQLGFQAPTPTTVLGASDIDKLGVTNIGQLSFQMPQFLSDTSPSNSGTRSGGSGAAFDLRGLGVQRTLTLVNSRHWVPNNANGSTDTNVLPSALIDRVEVVTGGASAAWGSDAVAGVVNIILKNNFEGLQLGVQAGSTTHADNQEIKTDLTYGTKFADGAGHFEISGEYGKNWGIPHQSNRSWGSKGWGIIANPTYTPTNGQYAQLLLQNTRTGNATYGGLITTGVLKGTMFGPGGAVQTYNPGLYPAGSTGTVGGDGPELNAPLNVLVPLERYSIYSRTSYDFGDMATVFLEASMGRAKSQYFLLDNFHQGNITINSDNAYLPAALKTTLAGAGQSTFTMGRIDSDLGTIHEDLSNSNHRIVVGANGKLVKDWTWDLAYEFGENKQVNYEGPIVLTGNYALATDAVASGSSIVCRSTLTNPANGCIPINLFGTGSPSPAAIKYVTGIGYKAVKFTEHAVSGNVQGKLFSTWAGPVTAAAGFDYRSDHFEQNVDAQSQAGLFLIGNTKAAAGAISVSEVFGEVGIPLIADKPFIKALDINLADRYINYSSTGTVNTYKLGVNYAATDEFRIRATQSRDIRAPNYTELFAFGGTQFTTILDPVTNTQANQVALIQSPNPALKPEQADTTTVGFVYEPHWLPRLHLSVDHYRIDIRGAIVSITGQDIVNRCFAGNTALCSAITRNSVGTITLIQSGRVNLSQLLTSGIDFEAAYSIPVPALFNFDGGNLTFRGLANYVAEDITNDGKTKIDNAGQVFNALNGVPHWKANITTTYSTGPVSLYGTMRYVGGGIYNPTYKVTDLNIQSFPGEALLDLGFRYSLNTGKRYSTEIFGHINNVLDTPPPIIPDSHAQSTLTDYALYDTIGRTFMLGARVKY